MKRILFLFCLIGILLVPASANARHENNAGVTGSCFAYLGNQNPQYRSQPCGTIYAYVKNSSNVWYVAATYNSGNYEGYPNPLATGNYFNYTQPVSSGANFYVYATGVPGQCNGTSQTAHINPGQYFNLSIFNMKVCY
jgi:hypothetical protein